MTAGRPENPVIRTVPQAGRLADYLRARRRISDLTYDELAIRTGYSATTLRRATSGAKVPARLVVLAIVYACGGIPDEANELWRRARYAEIRASRPRGERRPIPRLELIRDEDDFSAALVDLHERAGAPSVRTMEWRGGPNGLLAHTSVHRIITSQTLPADLRQLTAYLEACEVPDRDRARWTAAWDRVRGGGRRDEVAELLDDLLGAEFPGFDPVEVALRILRARPRAPRARAQQQWHSFLRRSPYWNGSTQPGEMRWHPQQY